MKAQHTVTISFTIPTAKIFAFVAGVGAGLALTWSVMAGVDLWAPLLGLPMLAARAGVQAVQDVEEHPAILAFDTVPLPVRVALDRLVEHVIAEKWQRAA